jgi:membrane protease YdiL (CAAX protease family)
MVGKELWLLPFAIWAAVIVAPITEEFAFRVLLQGYLESLARGPLSIEKIVVGSPAKMVQQVPWWPMIVSSVLFGLAHFGYGPSWLPLIFLGLVLGGLFRATGRVWASTALHVIFNSFAMLSLAVQIIAS